MRVLLLLGLLISGLLKYVRSQFGAGTAIHFTKNHKYGASSIAYLHGYTGVYDSGSREFTIDFWMYANKHHSDWNAAYLSIANEEDDNLMLFCTQRMLYYKSPWYYNFDVNITRVWYHQALTVNLDTRTIQHFLNGEETGSPEPTILLDSTDLSKPWTIVVGQDQDQVLGGFDLQGGAEGAVDNIRIWKRALSESEIKSTFQNEITKSTHPDIISYWSFNEGRGLYSDDVITKDPKNAILFADTKVSREILISKNLNDVSSNTRVPLLWSPSGAKTEGPGLHIGVAAGVKRLLILTDLTVSDSYVITATPLNVVIRRHGMDEVIPVGSVISFNVTITFQTMRSTEIIRYSSVGKSQIIYCHKSEPTQPKDFTVSIMEDAEVGSTVIDFTKGFSNSAGIEYVVYLVSLPEKGFLVKPPNEFSWASHDPPVLIPPRHTTLGSIVGNGWTYIWFEVIPNTYSSNYTTFGYKIVDESRFHDEEAISKLPTATVTISVSPENDVPELENVSMLHHLVERDHPKQLPIKVFDSDGDHAIISLHTLPKKGLLYLINKDGDVARELTKSVAGGDEQEMWVSSIIDFSSHYLGSAGEWGIQNLIGPQQSPFIYGDSTAAWSPLTVNNNCKDRGHGDVFHTEWVHIKLNYSTYIKQCFIYANMGVGTVVGIKAWHPQHKKWIRLWKSTVEKIAFIPQHYRINSPEGMCGTPFKTDQLYIEMDTCNVPGWNEIDAALVIGTHDLNTGIVLETQTITYVPEAGYTGPDEFSFYITDCLGNRFRKSNLFDVEITVEERKPFQTIKAGEGSSNDIHLVGNPPWYLTSVAKVGSIISEGKTLKQYDRIESGQKATYTSSNAICISQQDNFKDSFAISSGSLQGDSKLYLIDGCSLSESFPVWIFGLSGGILIVCLMFGVWFSTRQQREMNKLYNITRIAEECAECIAMMKLEEVAYLDELQNPNKIQKSFIKIIKTLREYRDYIPSSVLMGDTVKVEESDSESAAVPQVSEVSASVASFNSIGKSRSGPLNVHLNHLAICALRKRNVTVQCVNFSGFHRIPEAEILQQHAIYLSKVLTAVQQSKGVAEPFCGDRIISTWNAVSVCSDQRIHSYECCLTIQSGSSVTIGTASGLASVGNMGVSGMKKFGIIGSVTSTAVTLMRLCEHFSVSNIVCSGIRNEDGKVICVPLSRIEISQSLIVIYSIIEMVKPDEGSEWMYVLDKNTNPLVVYLDKLIRGDESKDAVSGIDLDSLPFEATKEFFKELSSDTNYFDSLTIPLSRG